MRALPSAVALLAASTLFSGCGARAEREALRDCQFAPSGIQTSSSGDSLTLSVKVAIRNPGKRAAVLDSFSAIASGGNPLARLSHGSTLRIPAGASDTALVHVRVASKGILALGLALAMSPPDSFRVEGTAWTPGFFGGHSDHPFRMAVPYTRLSPHIKSLVPSPL